MRQAAASERQEGAQFLEYARDERRDADNRRRCAEIAARHEETAAKYDTALAKLAA